MLAATIAASQRQALTISQSVSFCGQCILHFPCPFYWWPLCCGSLTLLFSARWRQNAVSVSAVWREGGKKITAHRRVFETYQKQKCRGKGIWIFYPSPLERKAKEKKAVWKKTVADSFLGFIVENHRINPSSLHLNLFTRRFTYKLCFNFKMLLISLKLDEWMSWLEKQIWTRSWGRMKQNLY